MAITTQEHFLIRPATMDDLDTVIELANICSLAESGFEEANRSEMQAEWTSPGFNLAESTQLVLNAKGKAVGYVEVWDNSPVPVRIRVWGRVHPEYQRQGIGTRLMEWAENRARQGIDRAPEAAQIVMECWDSHTNEASLALFQQQEMESQRNFYLMRIDLQAAPPTPQWPEGIRVKVLSRPEDDDRAILAVDDAFKDHWGHIDQPAAEVIKRWKHHMDTEEDFEPSLWFLALAGDEVAGVAFCWPKEQNDPNIGFVGTLGVRRPWRRQGLARALLLHAFGVFWQRNQTSVMLGVDASSLTGATRLYEQAGMYVYRKYIGYSKVLRAGVDITTQTIEA